MWTSLQSKLVMVGGCRNRDDEQRVEQLRQAAKELQLEVGRRWALLSRVGGTMHMCRLHHNAAHQSTAAGRAGL
jgi:hypothetical protein